MSDKQNIICKQFSNDIEFIEILKVASATGIYLFRINTLKEEVVKKLIVNP